MKHLTLKIEGMTCGHCVMNVKKELVKIPGVVVEKVGIGNATLNIEEQTVTGEMLSRAIEEAGYTLSAMN